MRFIYRLERKLGIRTEFAELWNRTIQGPQGSATLSPTEDKIVAALLLQPVTMTRELVEIVWPNPDNEPQAPEKQIGVMIYNLKPKLAKCGLRLKARGRQNARVFGYEFVVLGKPRPIVDGHNQKPPDCPI